MYLFLELPRRQRDKHCAYPAGKRQFASEQSHSIASFARGSAVHCGDHLALICRSVSETKKKEHHGFRPLCVPRWFTHDQGLQRTQHRLCYELRATRR
ncbi:hypothetical protein V5799_016216 [Amblyomma americanum]|uniref:Uncharacterized protein n=1 Tax=Amblyomma americanum TaxID=6943 RepID=A0AAQ4F5Q9_AMBAM